MIIGLIDYGMSNLLSVEQTLKNLGQEIKIVSDKQDALNPEKFVGFLKKYAKMNLVPVRGQYGKYWLSGVNGYDMIDGNKYYKLVFDSYGIGIKCTGDYNAFSMKGQLIEWMKAELPTPLVDSEVA